MTKKHIINLVIFFIVGSAIYANSICNRFVWDDNFFVRDNINIRSWSNIQGIFTEDPLTSTVTTTQFYRPLQIFTYLIDYSFWKLNVIGYHITNILLHILATFVLYWFIIILYNNILLASFTALLFVVHPIHTEAVTYISGRGDSLSLLFMLLTFIFYIKSLHNKNIGLYILMPFSYALALLSKENSLILPLLLFSYHYTFNKKFKIKNFLILVSPILIYTLLRITLLNDLLPNQPHLGNLFQRAPGFFVAIANYLRLILFPFPLHMEYGNKIYRLIDPKAISGIALSLSLLIYAFRKQKAGSLIFFAITWFFISLLPSSNIYPRIAFYMAEHYLYTPSIGFFLVVASGLRSLYLIKNFKPFVILFISSLAVLYSYLTIKQNNYWKEPVTFYERTLKYAPDSARVHFNLGTVYADRNLIDKAINEYKKALELKPDYALVYNNLGVIFDKQSRFEEAIIQYKMAINIKPNLAETRNNLGSTYIKMNLLDEAILEFEKSIELKANYAPVYNNIGMAYYKKGDLENAIENYERSIKLNPFLAEAYNNLGVAYIRKGLVEKARHCWKKALEINPNYKSALDNLRKIK